MLKIPREGADAAQMQDLVDAQIPVKVSGALNDPKVRPDLEGYLKGEVKKKVEEQDQGQARRQAEGHLQALTVNDREPG